MAVTTSQLVLVNNALNEGLHGLRADEVPLRLQTAEARALLDAVHGILGGARTEASAKGDLRRSAPCYVDRIR